MNADPVNPSPEAQTLWYYTDAANQPVGPLPFSDLQQLAAAEVIQPETHVIEEGGTEWKPFASVNPPPACTETKPASADIPLSSAAPANENAEEGFMHHGKEAEELFRKRERDLEAFAVGVAGKCRRYWKKAVELFDAYNCGLKVQADRRADKPVPEPGGQPTEKRQPTKKEATQAGAFFLILVIAITLWHHLRPLLYLGGFLGTWVAGAWLGQRAKQSKTLSVGGGFVMACVALALALKSTGAGKIVSEGDASGSDDKRTFAMTAEQFQTAFNKQQPGLQIESFRNETIQGGPWVSYVFDNRNDLKMRLEPGTRRICSVRVTFAKHAPENRRGSYRLANTLIYTLSPDTTSTEAWNVVDRLVGETGGSDEIKGKEQFLRSLSVTMVSMNKTDPDWCFVTLVFAPSSVAATPLPKTERDDGSPSDEIIGKFSLFSDGGKFKRGSPLISTGGHVPANTVLFPVRIEPDPYRGYYRYYFFRDEFGDWKVMRQEGETKVQIFDAMLNGS